MEEEFQFTKRKIVELTKKKDKKVAWISENLPDKNVASVLAREIDEITKQIEELKNRLVQLEVEKDKENVCKINKEIIADFLLHFKDVFDTMDTRQKRLLIQSVVKKVTVYSKNKIQLVLTLPIIPPKPVALQGTSELEKDKNYLSYQIWGD